MVAFFEKYLRLQPHSWTPPHPLPFIRGGWRLNFQNFQKEGGEEGGGVQIFPIKREGLVKLKEGGVGLFNYSFPVFIYTISISIVCVSQEEPSLIVSNQQMYDFYKWIGLSMNGVQMYLHTPICQYLFRCVVMLSQINHMPTHRQVCSTILLQILHLQEC